MARRNGNAEQQPGAALTGDAGLPFDRRISYLIYRLSAKLSVVANRMFAETGLDVYSSRIILLLVEYEEMRVGELASAMVLPQSTMSHQLARLEVQGLIRRQRAEDDNRSVTVTLTPAGRKAAVDCEALSAHINDEIRRGFGDEKFAALGGTLQDVFDILDQAGAQPLESRPASARTGPLKAG